MLELVSELINNPGCRSAWLKILRYLVMVFTIHNLFSIHFPPTLHPQPLETVPKHRKILFTGYYLMALS